MDTNIENKTKIEQKIIKKEKILSSKIQSVIYLVDDLETFSCPLVTNNTTDNTTDNTLNNENKK